jgi:hypothetical protein
MLIDVCERIDGRDVEPSPGRGLCGGARGNAREQNPDRRGLTSND